MKALFDSFESRSLEVQTKLGEILQTIQAGRVPSESICSETGDALSQLRETYNNVRISVADSILPEEMPEGEASMSEYRTAWETSIKRRKDTTLTILREFLQVYSEEERYMKALERPLTEAEALLHDLEDGSRDNAETKHYELFLKGVKTDLSADQELVYQIEDDLEGAFPARAISGLIQDKYRIRPIEEEPDSEPESTSVQEDEESVGEALAETEPEEIMEETTSEPEEEPAEEYIDMTLEEFAERFAPALEPSSPKQEEDVVDKTDEDFEAKKEEYLYAINTPPIPSKIPSDQKFTNIVNYSEAVLKVLLIDLPIYGFEEIKRIYDRLRLNDDPQYDKRYESIIAHLENKGLVYRYEFQGRIFVAFTDYAGKCFQKRSISDNIKYQLKLKKLRKLYFIGQPKVSRDYFIQHLIEIDCVLDVLDRAAEDNRLKDILPSASWLIKEGYFVVNAKLEAGVEKHLRATSVRAFAAIKPADNEGVICCADSLPEMAGVEDDEHYCLISDSLYQYKASEERWVCIVEGDNGPDDDPGEEEFDDDLVEDSAEQAEEKEESSSMETLAQDQTSAPITDEKEEVPHADKPETPPIPYPVTEVVVERKAEAPKSIEFHEKVSEFCKMAINGDYAINDNLAEGMILKLLEEEHLHMESQEPWNELSQALLMAKAAASNPGNERSKILYEQLLLATDVALDRHEYTGDKLIDLFAEPSKGTQAIMLAAYCFAMFAPAHSYDYNLKTAVHAAEADYNGLFPAFEVVKPVFHRLTKIWDVIPEGFTNAILDKLSDHAEGMANLEKMKQSAALLIEEPTIKTKISGLPELCSACFGPKSDMRTAIETVVANRRGDQDIVESLLLEYCNVGDDGYEISDKLIDVAIDKEWKKATKGKRTNHMTLAMLARDQVRQAFVERLEMFKAWVEYNANVDEKRIPEIRKLAHQLSVSITEALSALSTVDASDKPAVVEWMLVSIKDRLDAKISKQKLFVDLLQTGIVSVDLDGYPLIWASCNQVVYYEPWRLVMEHIAAQREDLRTVASSIVDGKPPYGDNLRQLEMIGKYLDDHSDMFVVSSQQRLEAQRSANAETEEFKNKLEIAYTYNRVEENDKENFLALINNYKELFFEIGDFANWHRFIKALEKQIDSIASKRKESLRTALTACYESLGEDEESTLLQEARKLLEEKENFAVTEEYINRFRNGERDLSAELSYTLHEPDSFAEFASEAVFAPLYEECLRAKGKNFSKRGQSYLIDHYPPMWTQRLKDDSTRLLRNWPTGQGSLNESQVADLFRGLGLNIKSATKVDGQRNEQYQLEIESMDRNMPDYRHPIAVFGTQAISPLNVVVFQGSIMAQELVDTMARLNLGSMSIALINYPVTMAYRREVAEIFHRGTIGHSSFLLIDQTLILHLALHQDTERLPILLKCTLPFTGYQPFLRDGGPTADEMFCGRVEELTTISDPNGASVVYGGRQLGKTALLERAESLTLKPEKKAYAAYCSIYEITTEIGVVEKILHDIRIKPYMEQFNLKDCQTIQELCDQFNQLMNSGKINRFLLLIDEADAFLHAISDNKYEQIRPLVELKRSTRNQFKFVLAGLHNVCRAKNATTDNGIFGQLGQPLCVKPLSPTDALQLISRPLRYLGFQVEMYPHLETILTNTNYYPGILQFFGYTLVQTLPSQYGKYYRANQGNPPFLLEEKQLGEIMNSSDLNNSIRSKFRWSLELDKRYFMLARCITLLYYGSQNDPLAERAGYAVEDIMKEARDWDIHCLENTSKAEFGNLLDEMVSMGILSCIDEGTRRYRLRRHSFINIIGSDMDKVLTDIDEDNEEVSA